MTAFVLAVGVVGAVIGSFLNVVVWRVPRGASVVRPGSHCPACGAPVRPIDNIPVVSWLVLRARCRDCRAPIAMRYPLVEAGTACLFAAMAVRFALDPALPAFLYLSAVGIALALIDLDVKRLPDALTLPSYIVGAVLLGASALASGEARPWLRALLGMAAMYCVYFALAFAYPAGMGFGDVKLSGVLGLYLGWLGWDVWGVGLLAGFLSGGFFGVVLLAMGRAGRKTALPFGPFMIAGALGAVLVGEPVARAWLGT